MPYDKRMCLQAQLHIYADMMSVGNMIMRHDSCGVKTHVTTSAAVRFRQRRCQRLIWSCDMTD